MPGTMSPGCHDIVKAALDRSMKLVTPPCSPLLPPQYEPCITNVAHVSQRQVYTLRGQQHAQANAQLIAKHSSQLPTVHVAAAEP